MNIISTQCDHCDLTALYGQWAYLNVSNNTFISQFHLLNLHSFALMNVPFSIISMRFDG